MKQRYLAALGRALAFCSEVGDGSLQGFVDRAAWELHHESSQDLSSIAFIVRRRDGSCIVGRPRELAALPVETLLGLLVEENGSQVACRVRDHALDTVRFIDARFRTSIVVRINFPKTVLPDGEGALWLGLQGSATPRRVDEAQMLARTVEEWFVTYAPVLQAIRLYGERIGALRVQLREMRAIAHDAKAPIGALQYLIADVAAVHPEIQRESERLEREIRYVEQLLSKFSPSVSSSPGSAEEKAAICDVVKRVCNRFMPESVERGNRFVLALPNENGPYARIAELTLERVLSNVIGNAVRYAQRSEIRIEVLRDSMKRVAIRVTDGGPGIPIDVIGRVNHADVHGESLVGTQGWGVGLVSCKAMLVTAGGDMKIAASSEGSVVDICVPEVAAVAIPRTNSRVESGPTTRESVALDTRHHVAAPRMDRGPAVDLAPAEGEHALFIIDDDVEHSASLERLLLKSGLCMRLFSTIEAAVQEMSVSMPGWILCDAHMPDGGAERLLQILAASRQSFRCAVMSGETDDDLLYRCAALGAREFFQKPLDIERLVAWASNGMNPPRTVASVAG